MSESGGHLSRLGRGQGALCMTPPLGAGLLVRPLRQLHSSPLWDVLYLVVFQMEKEIPCSRALLPAFTVLSLFIPVMGQEPAPHQLQGRPGQPGTHGGRRA